MEETNPQQPTPAPDVNPPTPEPDEQTTSGKEAPEFTPQPHGPEQDDLTPDEDVNPEA